MLRIAVAALAVALAFPGAAQQAQSTAPVQPQAAPPPTQPYASPTQQGYAPQQQGYSSVPPQGTGSGYAPSQPPPAPAPSQPYAAPPQQGYSTAQGAGSGYAAPPPQPQRYPEAQPVPGSTGTGSQQVVVNPPSQPTAPPPAPPPAPAPAVTVNPPPASSSYAQGGRSMSVSQEAGRPALETVAIDAGYGALAGALVGAGISLIDQGNNLGRNLAVGAGAGILVGAAIGGISAYNQGDRVAMDGLGSPEHDRLASAGPRMTVVKMGGRF